MRPQVLNSGQNPGSNDQKKSIFDRLGRQIDTPSGRSMKRRPSPGPYNDYMPPPLPSIHESEFNPYPTNRDPHAQVELEWRYQNERRHVPPQFASRPDRHPPQLPPHFELDMAGRQQAYYPHPPHPYISQPVPPQTGGSGINGPPGNGPPGPLGMQRSSPNYDRHGNPIMSFKDRGGPMRLNRPLDHHAMSPSRNFMPPGAMIPPGHEINIHEMGPMRAGGMYPPPQRWHEGAFEPPEYPSHTNRMMREGRFSPIGFRRFQQQQQQQQQQQPQMNNPQMPGGGGEATRYTKWRERRDVITTLDRETAQSSSRTDSLKSSLQQPDNRVNIKKEPVSSEPTKTTTTKQKLIQRCPDLNTPSTTSSNEKDQVNDKEPPKPTTKVGTKSEPQDISDGEIVDDEDSSDDSESIKPAKVKESSNFSHDNETSYINRAKAVPPTSFARGRESQQYYDQTNKKRRTHEDCSMDYETISDEDLDDFMDEKKISDIGTDVDKLGNSRISGEAGKNSVSEIELLNALGLDWANLVEMAKQSKSKETYSPGSALPRFSMPNYLPTLSISADLVGQEIYDLILKVCRS